MIAVSATAIIVAEPLAAAEFYARSAVAQRTGYDDNVNFTVGESGSDGSFLSASTLLLNTGARSPDLQFDVNAGLTYTVYPEATDLNSFDQFVGVTAAHTLGLSRIGVLGNFVSQTTRTSDVEQTGRFVQENSRQFTYSAGPFIETQLDPLNSLTNSATYTYQDQLSDDLPNFSQITGDSLWTRILSPRTQGQLGLNGFIYNSNSNGSSESESIGAVIGVVHQITPQLSARLLAGPQYTVQRLRLKQSFIDDFALSDSDTDSTNTSLSYQVDSGLTYQLEERTSVGLSYERSASPSTTSGIVTESDIVTANVDHRLLRSVSVGARAAYIRQTTLGGGGDGDVRDFVNLSPRISWQIQPDLRVGLTYNLRWQQGSSAGSGSGNDSPVSNAVFVTVNYDLPTIMGRR